MKHYLVIWQPSRGYPVTVDQMHVVGALNADCIKTAREHAWQERDTYAGEHGVGYIDVVEVNTNQRFLAN